jgi:uncharacterized protein (DUF1684 family)
VTTTTTSTFAADWQAWHQEHEARRADPHGFLAVTRIGWLNETAQRFPDAPGAWRTGADGVAVSLDDGEELIYQGQRLSGTHHFGALPERASIFAESGETVVEIAKRGGLDLIRPRNPHTELLENYHGTPAFEPDLRFAVIGRYVSFDQARPTTVGSVVEGLEHVYDAPGRVEFELDGQQLSLTAFPGGADGSLFLLFTDASSGISTYGASRSLSVGAPGADGQVLIDFNRATNLPCAYTELATCPLPPAENRLPVAIEAGEQAPFERSTPGDQGKNHG